YPWRSSSSRSGAIFVSPARATSRANSSAEIRSDIGASIERAAATLSRAAFFGQLRWFEGRGRRSFRLRRRCTLFFTPAATTKPPGKGDPRIVPRAAALRLRRFEVGGVEAEQPAQGFGRAVGRDRPGGVARLLLRSIVHVVAVFVGARQFLEPGHPRQPQ